MALRLPSSSALAISPASFVSCCCLLSSMTWPCKKMMASVSRWRMDARSASVDGNWKFQKMRLMPACGSWPPIPARLLRPRPLPRRPPWPPMRRSTTPSPTNSETCNCTFSCGASFNQKLIDAPGGGFSPRKKKSGCLRPRLIVTHLVPTSFLNR